MNKRHLVALCVAMCLIGPLPARSDVLQVADLYKHATAAFEAGDWTTANALYETLSTYLLPNSADRNVVDARRGYSLYRLGKSREARDLLEAALPRLPTNVNYQTDRALEHGALAAIYEGDGRVYRPLAAQHYGLALKDATSAADRVSLLIGLTRAAMFDPSFDPVESARRALTLAEQSGLAVESVASARAILGRALLNRGQPKAALEALQTTIASFGGLDRRVNELELTVRSDAALASLALGDQKTAQRYFAFSGSGIGVSGQLVWPNVNFASVGCDEDVKPEDVAVVELGIDENGVPQQIHTVYANRPGKPGDWFEDAPVTWRWSPQAVSEIGPVRRRHMRFELRCSRDWILGHKYVDPRKAWWAARNFPVLVQDMATSAETRLSKLRSEVAALELRLGSDSPALLPALDALFRNELVSNWESTRLSERALAIAQKASPPPRVQLAYQEDVDRQTIGSSFDDNAKPWKAYLAEEKYAADPESRAHLNYQLSNIFETAGRWLVAYKYLKTIIDDQALAEGSWEKLAARRDLLHHLAAGRNWDAAAKLVANIPSVGIPCSMTPSKSLNPISTVLSSASKHWGFTGWAFNEFDIGVDGRVDEPRVLVAYPPLVFTDDATADMARKQLNLGGAAVGKGCVRQTQFVQYK